MELNSLLINYLAREPKKRQFGVYWPSRIGYCLRQQYYEWISESIEYPEELLRIFEIGNIFQAFLKQVLENSQEIKLIAHEPPFSVYIADKDFFIKGRMDEVVLVEKDGETFIIEVKTHKNLNCLKEPHKEHLLQLNFYLKMIPKAKGMLVYIEKNDLRLKEFKVEFNQELFKEAIERASLLHESLLANKIPEPEAKLNSAMSWQCNYCLFKQKCKEDLELR
jgi:CRISPR-associated exonuclease Cas4